MALEITGATFEETVLKSDKPVVVDFWAAWCGPCRLVSPTIEKLAKEFKGRIITVKVNVDDKPHVAGQYQIQSIPTIMMFKNGQPVMRVTGAQPYETLKSEIQTRL